MVIFEKINHTLIFEKKFSKIKNIGFKAKLIKLMKKVEDNQVGKYMSGKRKGTKEVYLSPFRLAYLVEGNTLTFLDLYHKDEQ